MKILEIDLTNVRTFPKANFKTPQGLSLLTGPNGSGKSTIFQAVAWVLWGVVPGRSQDLLVRHGTREMVAKILIESNSRVYSIERRFVLAKSGKGGVTKLTLYQLYPPLSESEDVESGGWADLTRAINKETQAEINEIVGTHEVWSVTAYVGQREGAGQFLQANAYERKGILREIIAGAGDWDKWEGEAKTHAAKAGVAISKAEGAIEMLEVSAGKFVALQELLATAKAEQELTATALDYVEADLTLTQKKLDDAETYVREYNGKVSDLKDREYEYSLAEGHVRVINAEIDELDKLAGQQATIEADYEAHQVKVAARQAEVDKVRSENDSAREKNHEQSEAHTLAMAKWNVERSDWQENREAELSRLSKAISHAQEVDQAHESLKANVCLECGAKLTGRHAEVIAELAEEMTDPKANETDLQAEWANVVATTPPAAPESPNPYSLAELPEALGQDPHIMEVRERVSNAAALITQAEGNRKTWEIQQNEAMPYVQELREWIDKHSAPASDQIFDLRDEVHNAQARVRETRETHTEHATALGVVAGQEAAAARDTELLKDTREKLADGKTALHQWETVVAMCGTNGIRQLIIDQSLGAMESASNRWLQIIAPGFEIAFSTQTETDRETFEEGVIMPSGAIQPWSELSGAQSVAVALAVRMGLAEIGGAAQGIHYETLYLDEADSWLTGDYQAQFMAMLNRVADTGIDVVAITHIEAVQDMVDQQTRVVPIDSETSEVRSG